MVRLGLGGLEIYGYLKIYSMGSEKKHLKMNSKSNLLMFNSTMTYQEPLLPDINRNLQAATQVYRGKNGIFKDIYSNLI